MVNTIVTANTIALEAASDSCSVTLRGESVNETLVVNEARSHSKHFLPLIQSLLDKHPMSLADIDFISCGNGPGSFTGLRICFGVAQGLAFGLNIPLLTVSSLESIAFSYYQKTNHHDFKSVCLLDAHMKEVYLGQFEWGGDRAQPTQDSQLLSLVDAETMLIELSENEQCKYALIGPGVSLFDLPDNCKTRFLIDEQVEPVSSAVAEIALRQWAAGRVVSAQDAEINYLRNSVSWDKRKRIREENPNLF